MNLFRCTRRTAAIAALALGSLAAAWPASAVLVTYQFSGSVDSDEGERGWSAFSGSFQFDSELPDAIADSSTGAYAHAGAPWGMSISFDGGAAITLNDSFHMLVSNDLLGTDELGALASDAAGTNTLSLSLYDFSGTRFASDALPLPAGGLTLADFGWSTLQYESAAGFLQGRLDSLACTVGCNGVVPPTSPVPEPGTVPLLLAGLGVCSFQLRRSRNC
jgi:hypothetical protein